MAASLSEQGPVRMTVHQRDLWRHSIDHRVAGQIRNLTRRLVLDRWMIAEVGFRSDLPFSNDYEIRSVIRAPRGYYIADPIVLAGARNTFLVELFDFGARTGGIALLEPRGQDWKLIRQRVQLPGHLSYPFTFVVDDDVFLVCESMEAGVVALLTRRGEGEWVRHTEIHTGPLADPTIFRIDDAWVLIAGDPTPDGMRLMAMISESPFRGWRRCEFAIHPAPTLNRPGGAPIVFGDDVLLPIQDSASGYGASLAWHRVGLTSQGLVLDRVGELLPPRGFVGLHSFARSADVSLVDLRRFRLRLRP